MDIHFGHSISPQKAIDLALNGRPAQYGNRIPWTHPSTLSQQESVAYMEDIVKREPEHAAKAMYGLSQAATHFENEAYNHNLEAESLRAKYDKAYSSVQHRNIALCGSGLVIAVLVMMLTAKSLDTKKNNSSL